MTYCDRLHCNYTMVPLTDVFLMFFGKQTKSVADRKKLHQADDLFIVCFGLFMGLADKKNIEYHKKSIILVSYRSSGALFVPYIT